LSDLSAKSMHFTCILNIDIDIDIAIFCKYRIDVVSKLKKWYRSITSSGCSSWRATDDDNSAAVETWLQLLAATAEVDTTRPTQSSSVVVSIRCHSADVYLPFQPILSSIWPITYVRTVHPSSVYSCQRSIAPYKLPVTICQTLLDSLACLTSRSIKPRDCIRLQHSSKFQQLYMLINKGFCFITFEAIRTHCLYLHIWRTDTMSVFYFYFTFLFYLGLLYQLLLLANKDAHKNSFINRCLLI